MRFTRKQSRLAQEADDEEAVGQETINDIVILIRQVIQ